MMTKALSKAKSTLVASGGESARATVSVVRESATRPFGVTQDVMTPGINERCVPVESGVASSSSLNVRDRFGDLPFQAVLVGKVRQVSKQLQRSGRLLGRRLDGFRLFNCGTDNRQRIPDFVFV